jgi:DNA-directed RNA polymerase subunit M/transcription elongation factor TFIIS
MDCIVIERLVINKFCPRCGGTMTWVEQDEDTDGHYWHCIMCNRSIGYVSPIKQEYNLQIHNREKIDHSPDVGCRWADKAIGSKSKCVSCPFPKCVRVIETV